MPEKPESDKPKTPGKPRRQSLKAEGHEELALPECEALHLAGYLFEIGPTLAAGMGQGPVTHGEIAAWQQNTGIELQPWEARFVKQLSIEYLNESGRATDPACPPPWEEAPYLKPTCALRLEKIKNGFPT